MWFEFIWWYGCLFCYLLQYQADEPVTLWVNKVGPYNNPQETYNYYSLPFCHPGDGGHKWGGLGEVLGGNELIDSRIDIKFKSMFLWNLTMDLLFLKCASFSPCSVFNTTGDVEKSTICDLALDAAKVAQFKDAIENSYWFEFFMGIYLFNMSYGFFFFKVLLTVTHGC